MAITPLTSSDTFKTWFNTTNTIISTVNGITGVSGGSITGPYVISFNGLTGVITFSNYVSDFNGVTGSVSGVTGILGSSGVSISGSSTYPTITNTGVLSVNSQTGNITNVASLTSPQIFTTLQQFTAGISASGATFSGNISAPNILTTNGANVFTTLQQFTAGISASGATFNGNVVFNNNITAPNIVNSFNGITGSVTGVSSFNGLTGHVTGVTTSVGNNFTTLQTFSGGITASTLWVSTQCDIAAPSFTIRSPNTVISSAAAQSITFSGSGTQLVVLQSGQVIRTLTTNTGATTTVSILEYPITSYSSAEFLIQGERYTTAGGTIGTQTVKILMSATCGGSVYSISHTEYGNVTNGSSVATYTVDLSGSTWRLRVTPSSSNTMRFRTVATLYPNVGGVGSGA
jgi:hypothetical protein